MNCVCGPFHASIESYARFLAHQKAPAAAAMNAMPHNIRVHRSLGRIVPRVAYGSTRLGAIVATGGGGMNFLPNKLRINAIALS
jgi:hypothetical protein